MCIYQIPDFKKLINTSMKIREIIKEHEFPQAKERDVKDAPDLYDYQSDDAYWDDEDVPPEKGNIADRSNIEKLGTGAFASAYQHKDNPYDVVKGSKASEIPDGFTAFYDAIAKNKDAQSNPYFPRFRDMSKYTGQDNRKSYISRMEPLEKYQKLSDREREALLDRLFSDHGKDVMKHYWEEEHRNWGDAAYLDDEDLHKVEVLAWAIRAAIENNTWADELRWEIEDDKFKEAIEFLQDAAEESNYELDVHYNNLMVRRTSVGPQLVINDPLGMSSEAEEDDGW